MPYIPEPTRNRLDFRIEELAKGIETNGQLNYVITKLMLSRVPGHPLYDDFNQIMGVIESAKQEFYRRAVAPYEDQKIKEHGDVY